MSAGIKRGVFINTSKTICSIHESGINVFVSIAAGSGYDIDYYSMDMIDLDVLKAQGRVQLRDAGQQDVREPREQYDFWVFNWHYTTMAIDIDPSVIAALKGPKFTVVLELAPGDPLQLVPQGVFDGYIALDPDATATDAIYPFPRPLDFETRTPASSSRSVPVIGSFGFATPGKGFEAVVQAANLEFDRAIVRINIPPGDYIDTDFIHDRDYAAHLEELCHRIAKPGIEVRFTHDLMSPEQLIDWCGENDLNCFLYTRCQPGLAATTDQAIISGRPLVTSSNDTFRHVLRYLDPYPLTTLREAIEQASPKVRLIQKDWSKDGFNARFARMLADFGVLDQAAVPDPACVLQQRPRRKLMLATARTLSLDILDRPRRLANALGRTGEYVVQSVACENAVALEAAVALERPDAIVVTDIPGCDSAEIDVALSGFDGPVVHVGAATVVHDNDLTVGRVVQTSGIPVVPYFTVAHGLDEDPTIWLLGFTADNHELEAILRRMARELPGVRARVQLLPDATQEDIARINAVFDAVPTVWAEHHRSAPNGDAAIYTYATAKLVIVKNVAGHTDFLQNQAELAMITERAVVFSREAPFAPFAGDAVCFEDRPLGELVSLANAAQVGVVQRVSEGAAFALLKQLLSPALDDPLADVFSAENGQGRACLASSLEVEPDTRDASIHSNGRDIFRPSSASTQEAHKLVKDEPGLPDASPEDVLFVEQMFRQHLGRKPDPTGLRHYLRQLDKGVSRRRIATDIRRSGEARQHRSRRGAGGTISSVHDLLALEGTAFVGTAYRMVLGRPADPTGLAHHVGLLRAGQTKQAILAGLYHSPEHGSVQLPLLGLEELVRKHERSQSIPWRWFSRNKTRQIMSRSLSMAEHRMGALEAQVTEERERHEQAIAEMQEQVLHLESAIALAQMEAETSGNSAGHIQAIERPRAGSATILSYGRHRSGTLHILIGQSGTRSSVPSPYLNSVIEHYLASGCPVRLVEWDVTSKKIVFAAREAMLEHSWTDLAATMLDQHPPRGITRIALDRDSVDAEDWLLVCDTFRKPDDLPILMEVDLILEARRIGLENAFLFHEAGPLSRRNAASADVACHEQYMQALLLADGILATSQKALDELEHFFSVGQLADFTPPRGLVAKPRLQDEASWRQHGKSLSSALEQLRSQAPYIACNIIAADGGMFSDIEAGFRRLGIETHRIISADGTASLIPSTHEGASVHGPTNWAIVDLSSDLATIEAAFANAEANGFRVMTLLDEHSLPKQPEKSRQWADLLCKAHKIVCENDAVSSGVWRALLASRERFPCCEDRIVVVRNPAGDSQTEVNSYVRKLARLLADDLPGRRAMALPRKEPEAARKLMPRLVKRPKLSLCISTYNRAKWLDLSLGNIFRQIPTARDDLEVLVVDNCSTDETPQVGKKYNDRRDFTFIRNPVNVGMLGNLAVTSQRARGEYIWILGDDDLTRDGAIEGIIDLLDQHAALELIYMNYGYTSEFHPEKISDLNAFLNGFNVLQPACADEFSNVAQIAAKTENFYTAIYSHVYRRDHAMRSYCQDTSGRTFATMRACIPTTYYVLHYMAESAAYWIGEQQIVVNSNVSWAPYGPMLELEHLPGAWDLAERAGCPVEQVDQRRANRLWLVEEMWRNLFENDTVGNAAYISPARTLMRLRHLPEFEKNLPEFRRIYAAAHAEGNPAATMPPSVLFGAFS